jgi:hypothetical protein
VPKDHRPFTPGQPVPLAFFVGRLAEVEPRKTKVAAGAATGRQEAVVQCIADTATTTGLQVRAALDRRRYSPGEKSLPRGIQAAPIDPSRPSWRLEVRHRTPMIRSLHSRRNP